MIIATALCVFFAIFCLVLGIYILNKYSKQEQLRRRLAAVDRPPDVLDSSIFRNERMSGIGIVARLLGQLRFARRLEHLLLQAGMAMTVSVFLLMSLCLAGATWLAVSFATRHIAVALLAAFCVGMVPLLVVLVKKDRRLRAFDEHFPDALDLMVNALRAGFALNGAIQMAAEESPEPVGTEFQILFEEQKLGVDIRTALINFGRRLESTDAGYFVTAVIVQRETGGNLAEVLEKIAFVIRERFRILGEVRTFTAQGRFSGLILGVLPIVMAIVLSTLVPGYMNILLKDPIGRIMITTAVALQILGFLAIRRIVNIKV